MAKPRSVILFSIFVIVMGLIAAGLNTFFILSPNVLIKVIWAPYFATAWGIACAISGLVIMIGKRDTVHVAVGIYAVLLVVMGIVGKIYDMGMGGPIVQGLVAGLTYKFSKPFGEYMDIEKKEEIF